MPFSLVSMSVEVQIQNIPKVTKWKIRWDQTTREEVDKKGPLTTKEWDAAEASPDIDIRKSEKTEETAATAVIIYFLFIPKNENQKKEGK